MSANPPTASAEPPGAPTSSSPKPPTQLPAGRYPAAPTTVWMVSILVLVTEAVLAFGIPGR